MREKYFVEHTVGSIIGSAFKIYIRHFGTLFLIYVLPAVPVIEIQHEAQLKGHAVLVILSLLVSLIVSYLAYGATTIAVSDVCIGNAPSFKRSYTKILGKVLPSLLITGILQILAIAVGLVLMVLPGLVLAVWLILSPSIVVLEGRSGFAALKRSKQLADGSHWRNAEIVLLLSIVGFVSKRDRAIEASRWLHGFARAGLMPPTLVVPGVDTVNVTGVDLTMLGHGYVADARAVLTDMHTLITRDAPPDQRFGLRPTTNEQGERFWLIGA